VSALAPDPRWRRALHEASHLVIRLLAGERGLAARLIEPAVIDGHIVRGFVMPAGATPTTVTAPDWLELLPDARLEEWLGGVLAGAAGEAILVGLQDLGECAPALDPRTADAGLAMAAAGLLARRAGEVSPERALARTWRRAVDQLERLWPLVLALADELLARGELSDTDVLPRLGLAA